jgi:hypothetical protein
MDGRHFDFLARALSARGARRSLLGLLATLPVFGGLLALLDDDAAAKGRRKRRKKGHKHGKGKHKKHKQKKCHPEPKTTTCADACGQVTNNCQQAVDCGPCTCGGCPTCQVCDAETNACVADPSQRDEPCGEEWQVCQSNGNCACDAGTCPNCTTCESNGVCEACSGCCDDGQCVESCDQPANPCEARVCTAGVCEYSTLVDCSANPGAICCATGSIAGQCGVETGETFTSDGNDVCDCSPCCSQICHLQSDVPCPPVCLGFEICVCD